MIRYAKIKDKNKREIVLLKGYPCAWGKCSFCDYKADNTADEQEILKTNTAVLSQITGEYGAVEIINSGSVFELSQTTLNAVKQVVRNKAVSRLFFETHYSYKHRLGEMREFFGTEIIYKCGIETFDDHFRNRVLKKGFVLDSIADTANHFDSVCLLAGVEGQTKEMISRDVDILLEHFKYGCINLYTNNSTGIKADKDLQIWFRENYSFLEQNPNIDVLWNNTDFGVGGDGI